MKKTELNKLNKAELVALCEKHNVSHSGEETNAQLVEMLLIATAPKKSAKQEVAFHLSAKRNMMNFTKPTDGYPKKIELTYNEDEATATAVFDKKKMAYKITESKGNMHFVVSVDGYYIMAEVMANVEE